MRQRCFTIAICLLLGAISTIAVAWGIAVWQNPFAIEVETRFNPSDRNLYAGVWQRRGTGLVLTGGTDAGRVSELISEGDVTPGWLAWPSHLDARGASRVAIFGQAQGWPFLALASSMVSVGKNGVVDEEVRTGVELDLSHWEDPGTSILECPVVLPLRPLWPGFLINTLLYALGIWLVAASPRGVRRILRRRRGRCPNCGYDLRGHWRQGERSGCPECGWGRSSRP